MAQRYRMSDEPSKSEKNLHIIRLQSKCLHPSAILHRGLSRCPRRRQRHPRLPAHTCNRQILLPPAARRLVILSYAPVLDASKLLQQSHGSVRGLCESELLTDADPGPAVKGEVLPSRLKPVPALGPEGFGIGAKEGGAPVHGVDGPAKQSPGGDQQGGCTLRPAAERKDGVDEGLAGVARDDGVKPEGCNISLASLRKGERRNGPTFVENPTEVLELFELSVCGRTVA